MVALGDRSAGSSVYWSVYRGAADASLAAMVIWSGLRVDTLTASSKYTVRVWSSRLRLKDASRGPLRSGKNTPWKGVVMGWSGF